jgi:hypothetical protein
MSLTDFLFEGQAPPAVTQYGSRSENIPQFMSDYTLGLISRANAIAAEPYQSYGGPRVAGFTNDTQNAFNQTRLASQAYTGPLSQALGLTQQASQSNPFATASPYITSAAGMTQQAANAPGALSAASPYMQQASGTFTGNNVNQYMDPYVQNVVNRASDVATRNFNENLMPGIQDKFTRAGQYGSSGMLKDATRAARDTTENIQSQANAALSQAYQNAGQLYGQDASRQGTLAQLAGSLSSQDQAAKLQAAGQLGTLGSTLGTLQGQTGALQLQAGQQYGALGQSAQQLGLQGAAALDTIGQEQQGLNQRNLDTAYQDFQNQTQYPRQTIDWMSSVIRGIPYSSSTQTSQTGPANAYQPSPLSQIASLGTGIAGIQQLLGQKG